MILRRILVVDDEKNILVSLKGGLEDEGFVVDIAPDGTTGLDKMKKTAPDVVLLDIWMPGEDGIKTLEKMKKLDPLTEVIMMSGHGTVETAVRAIKMGAFDFLEKPIHFEKLLVLLKHVFELKELKRENSYLREELEGDETLTAEAPSSLKLMEFIRQTAPSNGWVLICGESGVGKELVARSIHQQSERSHHRLVHVNCSSLKNGRLESALFGHEKGAFPGAKERHIGKLEQADGGTLVLDEVGELPLPIQEQLLGVLEKGSVRRIGAEREVDLDVRIIATTSRDLRKEIKADRFSEALYYRLNAIPMVVPSLRERKEDIAKLVEVFLRRYSKGVRKQVSAATLKLLQSYPWPGNVRELKNWVEKACILSSSDWIGSGETASLMSGEAAGAEDVFRFEELSLREARAGFEKRFISQMLEENEGSLSKTAATIGLEVGHLNQKIKSHGIELGES